MTSQEWRDANRARIREYDRAWRAANAESVSARHRAWREANRERHQEQLRAAQVRYMEANPERLSAPNRSRRIARQRLTAERATRVRAAWLSEDDALVLSPDLSITEIALRLGRTYAAVQSRRSTLRKLVTP